MHAPENQFLHLHSHLLNQFDLWESAEVLNVYVLLLREVLRFPEELIDDICC